MQMANDQGPSEEDPSAKRKRGHPKGSKNKPGAKKTGRKPKDPSSTEPQCKSLPHGTAHLSLFTDP